MGQNIMEVVYGYMMPIIYAMTDHQRRAMASLGCLEAIRSGTTTIVDPMLAVPSYADTMADSGLRLYLCESVSDAKATEIWAKGYQYDRSLGEASLQQAVDLIDRHHDTLGGRVRCLVSAHAPDSCSPWILNELRDLARSRGLGRTVHLAQSPQEVEQVKTMTQGRTSAQYLDDHGWLGPDVLAAHCHWCDSSDIDLLGRMGITTVHCAASSSRRGYHRLAKVPALVDAGVNLTLGTDNMSEDMFDAMRIGIVVNRGMRGDGYNPTPAEVLSWATVNGARGLGRDDLGTLEAGKKADLSVIRLDRSHLTPLLDLTSSLVHYAQASDVESVMVDGEWVMRDGQVLTMDEDEVIQDAQQATLEAWRSLRQRSPDLPIPVDLEL
jgi:5-methylthioadenosine/S-adenosylhomocysteine deaminase